MRRATVALLLAAALIPSPRDASGSEKPLYFKVLTAAGGDFAGDGGPALKALLNGVNALAMDRFGAVYVAETGAHRIRRILADGSISTFAGTAEAGYSGDGGQADEAKLYAPYGLAFDRAGNLYVADLGNGCVRRISKSGAITTVAGGGTLEGVEGVLATQIRLKSPRNLAFGPDGTLYISDFGAHKVFAVSTGGFVATFAGKGTPRTFRRQRGSHAVATGVSRWSDRGPRGRGLHRR